MKPGDLIEELRQTLEATEDRKYVVSSSLPEVMSALVGPAPEVPLELPWNGHLLGERVSRHQVVLLGLDEDGARVQFFNPAAAGNQPAGAELGGKEDGPSRRVVQGGIESIAVEEFARYFAEGHAYALLPEA